MYSMKAVCKETNMPYETLKFYCNEGLVPNDKRNNDIVTTTIIVSLMIKI